jgi:alpha-ketoglutarate-dependent taurine dioxygenase
MPNITTVEPLVLPPGLKSITVPEQKVFDGKVFPLILVPDWDGARDWSIWLKDNAQTVKDLLYQFGAIVFRGFDVDTGKKFDDFCKQFGYEEYFFQGNFANRTPVVGHVYTANDAEGRVIPFHHELVHCHEIPSSVFFFCEYPSKTEGETPIVLSNIVYREMAAKEPEFVRRLHQEDISAIRVLPDSDDIESYLGTSWRSSFRAKTREEAEKNAKATGHYDLEWLPDGSLRCKIRPVPGIRIDKKSGKAIFFNYVHTAYEGLDDRHNKDPKKAAIWSKSGEVMSEKVMQNLKQALWNNCVQLKWAAGDIMLLDNVQVQHARNDFSGPRRILCSMYKDGPPRML